MLWHTGTKRGSINGNSRNNHERGSAKDTLFWNRCHIPLLFVLLFVLNSLVVAKEDLYQILGVQRAASTKEIKKAYRRKALDTHPDKNKNVAPDVAAAQFQKVVRAFEILSDTGSRKTYDRTGNAKQAENNAGRGGGGGQQQQQRGGFQFFYSNRRRATRLKDKWEVKEAQARVLHVLSLEQLQLIMLDDDDRLERHLLICFVTPKEIETIADDEIVFPYPFAGMSAQSIWWEDLLQTVKVRYNKNNHLTKFFNIPGGDELRKQKKPLFLFLKRGSKLDDPHAKLLTSNRAEFDKWVWERIEVDIEFINDHTHKVEVYWLHGTSGQMKFFLEPGESLTHNTMLSHEWWVRDARVDTRHDSPGRWKLADNTCLLSKKIINDDPNQKLIIEPKSCYDLSGHCSFWKKERACTKNPNAMAEECPLTCGFCSKDDDLRLREEINERKRIEMEEIRQQRRRIEEEQKRDHQHHIHQEL